MVSYVFSYGIDAVAVWCCSVLQCVAVCRSVLQYVAVCCTVLHCVALCCSVVQCLFVIKASAALACQKFYDVSYCVVLYVSPYTA